MVMALVNSAPTTIQTVEQCTNCFSTANPVACNLNLDLFTSVCCAAGETDKQCGSTSVCSNNFRTGFPNSSKFILCPSPNECGFTEFNITELDRTIPFTFNTIPGLLFCRVRIFIGNIDQSYVRFTNIVPNNAVADVFFTQLDSADAADRLDSVQTFRTNSAEDVRFDISEGQSIYVMLTPSTAGTDGSFSFNLRLERYQRSGLSTTEIWMLVVLIVWLGIVFLWFLIFICKACYEKNAHIRNNPNYVKVVN
jgi:hypothetical protein